jgi:glycosyltransferase involved in cell wall biosynthesis
VRFWAGWEPVAAGGVAWGLQQLRELAARTSLGVADSHYNEEDLLGAGYAATATVPLLVDVEHLLAAPTEPIARRAGTSWLFVGRLAPNKAQHDLVKALAAARRFHDPDAHLTLVGGGVESAYGHTLRRFVRALDLENAVTIAGTVSPARLSAHYDAADVLVVASEHEGFCVPLLEAMSKRLPIVAYAAAAVPETLADAGLLLHDKGPCTIAAAVARLMADPPLRDQLVDAGVRRLRDFDVRVTGPAFVDAVESVLR